MALSSFHSGWLILLFLNLICFSLLGFRAARPGSSKEAITAFWISIVCFLVLLAAYLALYSSPLFALAPLIPAFLFGRLCYLTLWAPLKKSDGKAPADLEKRSSRS